jgi:hypothetical protein
MRASLSPQAFVDKWRQAALKERAAYQEHFDLGRLLAHPTPAEAEPQGAWFTFEAGATWVLRFLPGCDMLPLVARRTSP